MGGDIFTVLHPGDFVLTCGKLREMRFFFRFYWIFGPAVVWHVFFRCSCLLNCVLQRVLSLMQVQCSIGPFSCSKSFAVRLFHGLAACVSLSLFLFVVAMWRFLCFLYCLARLPALASPSFSLFLHLSSSLCLLSLSLSLTPVDLDLHLDLDHSSCGLCCKILFL